MNCTCNGRAGQSEGPHARQILEMIAYKRITKKIDIEEAEHREERNNEISSGKEHRAPPCCADEPQPSQDSQRRDDWKISAQVRRIDSPARINENQRIWPDELAKVKPDRPAGDDNALERRLCPLRTHRASMKLLFPNRPDTRRRGKADKSRKRRSVSPADSSFAPPNTQREHNRQHHGGRFAENSEPKK